MTIAEQVEVVKSAFEKLAASLTDRPFSDADVTLILQAIDNIGPTVLAMPTVESPTYGSTSMSAPLTEVAVRTLWTTRVADLFLGMFHHIAKSEGPFPVSSIYDLWWKYGPSEKLSFQYWARFPMPAYKWFWNFYKVGSDVLGTRDSIDSLENLTNAYSVVEWESDPAQFVFHSVWDDCPWLTRGVAEAEVPELRDRLVVKHDAIVDLVWKKSVAKSGRPTGLRH